MEDKKSEPVGQTGERLAALHLTNNNYEILATNYRAGHGEIDIIARKDNLIIFVEVKTKKFGDFGEPINWVTRSKQRQIGKIAQAYLIRNGIHDMDCRFDVITLTWDKGTYQIEHIENAFWL